ncbi:MAG: hypothetical protein ACXQT4_00365 [Methanotrichaceae archaeon]
MSGRKGIDGKAEVKSKIYALGSARASIQYKKGRIDQLLITGKKDDVIELLRQIVEEEQLQEADA